MKIQKFQGKSQNFKVKVKIFALWITLLLFAFCFLPLQQVQGQSPVRSFTITPPTISVSLAPGGSTEGLLAIKNDTDEAIVFSVLVKDFIVTDTLGTPTMLPPNTLSNPYAAASWIGVSPTHVLVPAHTRQEFTYFISIPPTARPGGHYAAVIYAPANGKSMDSTGATVNSHIGTLFSVLIEGESRENALVTRFFAPPFQEYGPVSVQTQIKNLSDSHIRPVGTITFTDMLGSKQVQYLQEHNIFPQAARDYVHVFGQTWMFGRYTITVDATYGKTSLPLRATMSVWIIPWKIIVVIILCIIAAVLALMLMKKKRDQEVPPIASPPSESTL